VLEIGGSTGLARGSLSSGWMGNKTDRMDR
jgi:hypothetical protein